MEGMPVNYIGLDDLIAAKTAAGRKQDLLDLEALYRVKRRQEEHRDR
jgi:predicted nucleotidyltransferase